MSADEVAVLAWIGLGTLAFYLGYLASFLPVFFPRRVETTKAIGVALTTGATVGFALAFWLYYGDSGLTGSAYVFPVALALAPLMCLALMWSWFQLLGERL